MKKLTMSCASVLLTLVSMTLAGCDSSDSRFASLDFLPVQTKEDAKWGFIGPDGKMLYEEEFENAPSPVINGFFTVEENGGMSVYRAQPKKPELLKGCEDLVSVGRMSDGLIPVTHKNSRICLVDESGKEKLTFMPVDGHEITSVNTAVLEGAILFNTDEDKTGLMSPSGKVLIPARYDYLNYAGEGLMVATVLSEPDSVGNRTPQTLLLDKKGNEKVRFKDEISIQSRFVDGNALVMKKHGNDKIPGFVNKKGEFTKLPGKVNDFGIFYNGKEFIFQTEDEKEGVMTLDGEILIRPKYKSVAPYDKDRYCAEDGDNKWLILSRTGEKEKTYDDFEGFVSIRVLYANTKFEVIAAEKKHRIDFYTFEGKPVSQESFYNIIVDCPSNPVYTDYFNAAEAGEKIAGLIDDYGVKGIKLDSDIQKILPKDAKAENYAYRDTYMLPDIHGGYRWSLSVMAKTPSPIALPIYEQKTHSYGYYSYVSNEITGYKFENPKISHFEITAESSKDLTTEAVKSLTADLAKRGFKQAAAKKNGSETMTTLTKGKTVVVITRREDNENSFTVTVGADKPKPETPVAEEEYDGMDMDDEFQPDDDPANTPPAN